VETIENIQLLEKDNHEKLVLAMEQVKEKLKRIRQGQKSVALYEGSAASASGSFFDKKK
jgi:translation elongation factor P/translation initiation factor 5A